MQRSFDREAPPLRREDTGQSNRGDDLRATPFTDEVFAEDRGRREVRGNFSLIVGVVLGLALIGGVGFYAFRGRDISSLAPGEIQTVKADPEPYKIKPENPGGLQVDNQDKLVYDRVTKSAAPNRVENLLPPPEVPKALPGKPQTAPPKAEAKSPPPKQVADAKSADAKAPEHALPQASEPKTEAKAEPSPAVPARTSASDGDEKALQAMVRDANVAPTKPAPPSSTPTVDPLAAAVAAVTHDAQPEALNEPKPAEKPAPASAAPQPASVQTAMAVTPTPSTPAAASAGSSAAPAGAYAVQLASVPSEEDAQAEWKRISNRRKDLLQALTPNIAKADLGDRGITYRLKAGPLADKAAADQLCSALAADRISCIVVKP